MKRFLTIVGLGALIALTTVLITREAHILYVQESTAKNSLPKEIKDSATSVLFVGDLMLGRNVENIMEKSGNDFPFTHVKDLMKNVDGVVANLEGPIMTKHVPTPSLSVTFSFASTTAKILSDNNVKLVSLANNHTADFGTPGFLDTHEHLDKAGVSYVGQQYTLATSSAITRKKIGSTNFLFIAFNLTNPNLDTAAALQIAKLVEKKPDEFVVAMVHGGEEYVLTSGGKQQRFYRGLIEAGADLVIAHHPHVVQEVELYRGKPIFYSLGNFLFDQYFSDDVKQELTVRLTLTHAEAKYELIPLNGNRSRPSIMTEAEKTKFLKSLSERSSKNIQGNIEKGELIIAR
jgi:gamma-polyglutamate biosynthesis protein CapA